MIWRAVALGLLLPVCGCMVGPDYQRPSTPTSNVFKEQANEQTKTPAENWNVAQPSAPSGAWWQVFSDPRLDALEDEVTTANQDLKFAEARLREARQLVLVNRANLFPTLGAGIGAASVAESANRPFSLVNLQPSGDFTLPLDLDYEIDLWGRVRRGVQAAADEAQASAADLATASLSLHAELALDYFELRAADRQKLILDDAVKSYEDALKLTTTREDRGTAPESDVAQAQTQLETARAEDTDITLQRARYEHAIAVLAGKPPAAFSLPPLPLDLNPPQIPAVLPSDLLQRRPDIAAYERRVAEANEQIGIAEAAYYPSVNLGATAGMEGSSLRNWFEWPSLFWSVGLSMSETLFDAGRRHAATEAAGANYDALVARYRQATLAAFQEVEDNLAAARILAQESAQQRAAVAAAQNSLNIFNARYIGGVDNYLSVIVAQTTVLTNQRTETDILRRRMEASILLIKALGGGWTSDQLPGEAELRRGPLL